MSRGTLDPARSLPLSDTGPSPSAAAPSRDVLLASARSSRSLTPRRTRRGLGSSRFARRYSGNRCFFLFLRLLRCFSSPGSPRMVMYSPCGGGVFPRRVSPFRHRWIDGYLPLPSAFRSLSRLSSALSAKASTPCSCYLDQTGPCGPRVHSVAPRSFGGAPLRPRPPSGMRLAAHPRMSFLFGYSMCGFQGTIRRACCAALHGALPPCGNVIIAHPLRLVKRFLEPPTRPSPAEWR